MDAELTVANIIERAGGAAAIARACSALGVKLKKDAVYKWPAIGIPDRHWPIIIGLACCDVLALYKANCAARGQPYRVFPQVETAE